VAKGTRDLEAAGFELTIPSDPAFGQTQERRGSVLGADSGKKHVFEGGFQHEIKAIIAPDSSRPSVEVLLSRPDDFLHQDLDRNFLPGFGVENAPECPRYGNRQFHAEVLRIVARGSWPDDEKCPRSKTPGGS